MIRKKIVIVNKLGLHARAAAKFVATASRYGCDIQVDKDGRRVNGKSIMGVMMLAASQSTAIELIVTGEDEQEAISALETLINDKFGEGD